MYYVYARVYLFRIINPPFHIVLAPCISFGLKKFSIKSLHIFLSYHILCGFSFSFVSSLVFSFFFLSPISFSYPRFSFVHAFFLHSHFRQIAFAYNIITIIIVIIIINNCNLIHFQLLSFFFLVS